MARAKAVVPDYTTWSSDRLLEEVRHNTPRLQAQPPLEIVQAILPVLAERCVQQEMRIRELEERLNRLDGRG